MQETIELRRVLPETDHLPISRVGPRARYFYFFMALLVASVVVFGFGQTVGPRFLHTPYHKPLVLTVHAAVFSAWILFYLLQSGLVRAGNVRIHRLLRLFGAAFRNRHSRDRHDHCRSDAALRLAASRSRSRRAYP